MHTIADIGVARCKTAPNAVDILTGLVEIGPYCSAEFLSSLRDAVRNYPSANWSDSLSRGQIRSKRWLVRELRDVLSKPRYKLDKLVPPTHLGSVYICAGWYAVLAEMLSHVLGDKITRIRSFDSDPQAVVVADRLMKHRGESWFVKSVLMNIHDLKFKNDKLTLHRYTGEAVHYEESPDTVINTSCEHIVDFEKWWSKIPDNVLVVVQSNDYSEHVEHINCAVSLEQFAEQTPMKEIYYAGSLGLDLYTRFMRIGVK